jgi:hypothetical protein
VVGFKKKKKKTFSNYSDSQQIIYPESFWAASYKEKEKIDLFTNYWDGNRRTDLILTATADDDDDEDDDRSLATSAVEFMAPSYVISVLLIVFEKKIVKCDA